MKVETIIDIAYRASELILEVYKTNFNIDIKSDQSPVTIADKRANDFIVSELEKTFPNIPVIAEESEIPDYSIRKHWTECFIIDPLDGTKEFINKNDEFTINIAYIHSGKPVYGVVYAPVLNLLYFNDDKQSYRVQDGNTEKLPLLEKGSRPYTVVCSKSHLNEETINFITNLNQSHKSLKKLSIGSSLKFCLIAQGSADIYPRLSTIMEWDSAAAHAICNKAGVAILELGKRVSLCITKRT